MKSINKKSEKRRKKDSSCYSPKVDDSSEKCSFREKFAFTNAQNIISKVDFGDEASIDCSSEFKAEQRMNYLDDSVISGLSKLGLSFMEESYDTSRHLNIDQTNNLIKIPKTEAEAQLPNLNGVNVLEAITTSKTEKNAETQAYITDKIWLDTKQKEGAGECT